MGEFTYTVFLNNVHPKDMPLTYEQVKTILEKEGATDFELLGDSIFFLSANRVLESLYLSKCTVVWKSQKEEVGTRFLPVSTYPILNGYLSELGILELFFEFPEEVVEMHVPEWLKIRGQEPVYAFVSEAVQLMQQDMKTQRHLIVECVAKKGKIF